MVAHTHAPADAGTQQARGGDPERAERELVGLVFVLIDAVDELGDRLQKATRRIDALECHEAKAGRP